MADFLCTVISLVAVFSLFGYLFYPGASKKTESAALLILLLYFVSLPIASFIGEIRQGGAVFPSYEGIEELDGGVFYDTAEQAFCEGIINVLAERYSIDRENVTVAVEGFSLEKMNAEKIKILLSGKAALSNIRGIEEYVAESGLGECEVKIKIG